MADHLNLRGRRAFVTGGSKGIGAAIVRRLCMQGAEVVLSAQDMPLAERLAAETGARAVRPGPHRSARRAAGRRRGTGTVRHPGQQRRPGSARLLHQNKHRGLALPAGGEPGSRTGDHACGAARHAGAQIRPHHQYRFRGGTAGIERRRGLCRRQGRRHRLYRGPSPARTARFGITANAHRAGSSRGGYAIVAQGVRGRWRQAARNDEGCHLAQSPGDAGRSCSPPRWRSWPRKKPASSPARNPRRIRGHAGC